VEDAKEVLHGKNQLADQFSSTEIAIIIDDVINRKPRFYQSKYVSVFVIRDRYHHTLYQQQEAMLLAIEVLTLTKIAIIIDRDQRFYQSKWSSVNIQRQSHHH
jgi:hypothetical protein